MRLSIPATSPFIKRAFAVLTAIWLAGLIRPVDVESEIRFLLQLFSLAWITIFALLHGREYFVYGPIFRQDGMVRNLTLLSFAAFAMSAVGAQDSAFSMGYVLATGVGLLSCGGLWYCIGDRALSAIGLYSLMGSLLFGYVYWTSSGYGRLVMNQYDHPNHMALISFGVLACSLALPNRVLMLGCVTLNFLVLIATQSRSALVAAAVTFVTYLVLTVIQKQNHRGYLILAATSVLLFTAGLTYQDEIWSAVSQLLYLNDRYRGLGTGITGRFAGWREAYQLFLDNPFLGVGFRSHEQYMTTLSSAHNGYLSLLAETGVLGVMTVGALIVVCLKRLVAQAVGGDRGAIIGVSFLAGYLVLAVFERFLINVGNPTSMLAWLFLFMPERRYGIQLPTTGYEDVAPGEYALAHERELQ